MTGTFKASLLIPAAFLVAMLASEVHGAPEVPANPSPIRIHAPESGSVPRSGYLAIDGTAPPETRLEVLDLDTPVTTLDSEEDGHFDIVLRLKPGEHKLRVRVMGDRNSVCAPVTLHVSDNRSAPLTQGLYEQLREGDILLSRDSSSLQVKLYNPRYTHAGIYLGPDRDGTPVILEPFANQGPGVIAAVPIEESLGWTSIETGLYRLKAGFRPGERGRLLAWEGTVVKRRASFWTISDFGAFYRMWLMWDSQKDRPRNPAEFEAEIDALRTRMNATDRFDCVTLVWQAYLAATEGRIDLANPNQAKFQGLGSFVTPRFLARVGPVMIVPDTFASNGKLALVAGR